MTRDKFSETRIPFEKDNLFIIKDSSYTQYSLKIFKGEKYNFVFDADTGKFARWGKNPKDDPDYAQYGPEIADIEISEICRGLGKPCEHCYKSNTPKGRNMTFETFKKIFHRFPHTLTQIAFGLGDVDSNPDLFKIMRYCRDNSYNPVIPNITINGYNLTKELASELAEVCGAVSVSKYEPKDYCYDSILMLSEAGLKQVNIHALVSEETYDSCMEVMRDSKIDPRLKGLNAIVFLLLKPKGKRNKLTKISAEKYKSIIDYALANHISIGCDSCSSPRFLKAIKDHPDYKKYETYVEPCESNLFSIYLNCEGKTVPCSFLEDMENYQPLDVLNCNDFLKDIWFHEETIKFRNKLLETAKLDICRRCPEFDIY